MRNFIGIDDGHYSIKLCTMDGKTCTIPSRVVNREELCYSTVEKQMAIEYEVNGDLYTVIPEHQKGIEDVIDTRTNNYPFSCANQALVLHVLNKMGFNAQEVSIVTGLPLEFYYKDGLKNEVVVQKKINNLLNINLKCVDSSILNPIIKNHTVISEAVATLYDVMYDFDLNPKQKMLDIVDSAPVAIIDIGGRTIDIASIREGGETLYHKYSGTKEYGALTLIDEVAKLVKSECGVDISAHIQLIEQIIKTGIYCKAGKNIDLGDKVKQIKDRFAQRIITKIIPDILGTHKNNVQMVLFTGGGSLLIKDHLLNLEHDNVVLVDDPQFSNARGMAKVAIMLERNTE